MKFNFKSKKLWILVIILIIIFFISTTSIAKQKDTEIAAKDAELSGLKTKLEENEKTIDEMDSKIVTLEEKVAEAEPWFDMSEKEQQRKIEEEKAKEEAEKAAAEAEAKKKEEEEAKKKAEAEKKAEEEAKKGYETGITYDQLARTPDDYIGEKIKFSGKVIQVIEGDGSTQIRFAVDDNYDTVLYGEFDSSIVESRILEDDHITIMGLSGGLLSYESTMGGNITIPSVLIEKVEQ
ncbi:toxin regulator [Oceanobacillus polygoni]|uniref:TolA-binding protein n=1 Tax=Oceanobacillus polygoni TaxID=1235259 RepID=A0A9X0YNM2_9BACI|nr:toxin regulator [Oceanobacillus polygoni]MBP2075888.1 TolA-binding protein [Oceanobacillus polygoni]